MGTCQKLRKSVASGISPAALRVTAGSPRAGQDDFAPTGSAHIQPARSLRMNIFRLILFLGLSALFAGGAAAQTPPDADAPIGSVEVRTVSVNLLAVDRETRRPVADLGPDDIELHVDGKRRQTDYFGFRGAERKPLVIFLCANLAPDGARRQLLDPDTLPSLRAALARLGPRDRVGVLVLNDLFAGRPDLRLAPTRDFETVLSVFAEAISTPLTLDLETRRRERDPMERVVETVRAHAPEDETAEKALILVSDGINSLDTFGKNRRNALADRLAEDGISLSAVKFDPLPAYAAAATVLNPLGFVLGMSVTGAGDALAEKTGGLSLKAKEAGGLGPALARVLDAYAARYEVGFPVEDDELNHPKRRRITIRLSKRARKARQLTLRHRPWFSTGPSK